MQSFPYHRPVAIPRLKILVYPTTLSIPREEKNYPHAFPRVLPIYEIQIVLTCIGTRNIISISDDNYNETRASWMLNSFNLCLRSNFIKDNLYMLKRNLKNWQNDWYALSIFFFLFQLSFVQSSNFSLYWRRLESSKNPAIFKNLFLKTVLTLLQWK